MWKVWSLKKSTSYDLTRSSELANIRSLSDKPEDDHEEKTLFQESKMVKSHKEDEAYS